VRRFRHGLVLGKFYPFHAGHQQLVRAASARCGRVTVQVLASSVESIDVEVRGDWIRSEHPEVDVVTGMDEAPVDFDDPVVWDLHMRVIEDLLDAPVDAVFTSDGYGVELARRLGATWCRVDPGRRAVSVSGTAVRADVAGHWWALPTAVREWFCRRVVVLGAESTGTTTLASALAEHHGVPWIPEYGREWTLRRPGGPDTPWHTQEFDLIAAVHAHQEVEAMRRSPRPLVVSDTDVLATTVWHERYVGSSSPSVTARARAWTPDLYLLTGDEIPFVQDGLRDGEHLRHAMQGRFREVVAASGVPWVEVSGTPDQRLATAVAAVDGLLARGWDLADPLEVAAATVDTGCGR
jgi:NadR type nicotinamide-nucleotide adenylyltransferase